MIANPNRKGDCYFLRERNAMHIFGERRNQLISKMKVEGIEAALIMNPSSIYYLTGLVSNPHERFLGLFLFADGNISMIAPALDLETAKAYLDHVIGYSDSEGPISAIKHLLGNIKVKFYGVEKEYITLERSEWLRDIVPDIKFASISTILHTMRSIKDTQEIDFLRKAAHMVDQVVTEGIKSIRRGITEMDLANELELIAKRLGSPKMSFETSVLSGAKSAAPHGKPDSSPIVEGEYLLLDLGVMYKGYCSDITRTFIVGNGTDKHKEIYELVLLANTRAIEHTKAGRALKELDSIARKTISDGGYGEFFTHRLGHGLGLEIHEYPSVHGENVDLIQSGLVFTIEPGVYVPGFGGVRIEDDVLVTESGVEVLTRYPKDWNSSIIYME